MKPQLITEAELHAYVDGVLPLSRQQEIKLWLIANPPEQVRLQAYTEQNTELRRLFDTVLDEPLPSALQRHLSDKVKITNTKTIDNNPANQHAESKTRIPPQRLSTWSLNRIAASVVFTLGAALSGGIAGWTLHGLPHSPLLSNTASPAATYSAIQAKQVNNINVSNPTFAHYAAVAHAVFTPEVKRPVELGADQEEQLVKWLSKRLDSPIRPPHLAAQGYELVGGRLLPGNSGPVAQFMYQNTAGQRLTLYLSNENKQNQDTGFQYLQDGQVNVFYWIDGKFGYALSGSIEKNDLSRVANLVYEQLQSN
ncbi:anti-sigma factor [soil metagenome]